MTDLPPVTAVLPHAGPAVLLTRILEHEEVRTVCLAVMERREPVWLALELMSQCIAAHAGLRARSAGEPVKVGLLVGARRVDFTAAAFAPGQALVVDVARVWGDREAGAFACAVSDHDTGAVLARASLSVVRPESLDALAGRGGR
jgi:predicted hotdog family 3-hydroxylacyl-ACP dehydratase